MADAHETAFRHRPYAGGAAPFSIGLKPIAPEAWLAPDADSAGQIAEKRALLAAARDVVVRCRADTRPAQAEALALVAAQRGVAPVASPTDPEPTDPEAIVQAALLVPDDLVLMRREPDGWRLVAACLCFPSTWSLAQKFDTPMDAIHAEVPGYPGQMAARVARIFDHLPADQIVERFNWSIYPDDRLHHPEPRSGPRPWRALGSPAAVAAQAFIRVERQTLRRLPMSGDLLFTIRVLVDPLAALAAHPDGAVLAGSLEAGLRSLDPAQLAYKNLAEDRDALIGALQAIAAERSGGAAL